jgi:hypothetical protein
MTNKTLLGKNDYLFLINDSCRELQVHCNGLDLVKDKNLSKYKFNNFMIIIFPNKSLICKNYLPDQYFIKYRPALDIYKKVLHNKVIDTYDILKNQEDVYYKTDTHINVKGSYIVYKYFVEQINKTYNLNIQHKEIEILSKKCFLAELHLGIGDLLWPCNLGDQIVNDKTDTFYYSNGFKYVYCKHEIQLNDEIRILSKDTLTELNDKLVGSVLSWDIVSNYILYKKNTSTNKLKVLIFYDSFLIPLLDLYLSLFGKVYMSKDIYNDELINMISPDYVFEFRVERFLM